MVPGFLLDCDMTNEHIERALSHPAYCVYALSIKDALLMQGIPYTESRVQVDAFGIAHASKGNLRFKAVVPNHKLIRDLDAAETEKERSLLSRKIKPHSFRLKFVFERRKQKRTAARMEQDRNYQKMRREKQQSLGRKKSPPVSIKISRKPKDEKTSKTSNQLVRLSPKWRPRQAHLLVV